MTGGDSDAPSEPPAHLPDTVDGAHLVGLDGTGVPIYFDEENARAFEALESEDEWIVGEERSNADLGSIVEEISQLTGWEALSERGRAARHD